MVMEEQLAESLMSSVAQGAVLALRVSERGAGIVASATGATIMTVGHVTKNTLRQGRESIVTLTNKSGTDLHFTEQLSREDIRVVRRQLHRYGLHYGIEKNPDTGKYYIVFKGSDADMVKHALERALDQVGGTLEMNAVDIPEQTQGVVNHAAEQVAVTKAEDLIPLSVAADAPMFAMTFQTKPWDREAKIIGDNLTKMRIPYSMTQGASLDQVFTFPRPYAPAVKQFIDSYAQHVSDFDTSRIRNYEQLSQSARTSIPRDERRVPHSSGSTRAPARTNPQPAKLHPSPSEGRDGLHKKTAVEVRREIKQDTKRRIAQAPGSTPVKATRKSRSR